MSTEALASPISPPDALAATQRVQQLQELLTQAGKGTSTASFAAALEAASAGSPTSTAPSAPAAGVAGSSVAGAGLAGSSLAGPEANATTTASYGYPTTSYPTTSLATTSLATTSLATTSLANIPAPSSQTGSSTEYDALISQAAARYGLNPAILHGLIQQESGFNASSRSSAGAEGLTQLMPATASSMGVSNPLDPAESIEGGARYLSQLMSEFGGNTSDALAAYNAGPGAVKQYGGVPPYAETQEYVTKVLGYANAYQQSQPAALNTEQSQPAAQSQPATLNPGQIT